VVLAGIALTLDALLPKSNANCCVMINLQRVEVVPKLAYKDKSTGRRSRTDGTKTTTKLLGDPKPNPKWGGRNAAVGYTVSRRHTTVFHRF
jgi:NAD dependent epimerase/dehydratase family enzyme